MRLWTIAAALWLPASVGWAAAAPGAPTAPLEPASAVCAELWLQGGALYDAASGAIVWSDPSETVTALACPDGGAPMAAIGATRGARGEGKIVLLAPGAVPGALWSVTGEIATRAVPRRLVLEGGRLAVVLEGRKDASFGVVDAVAGAKLQTVVLSQKPSGLAVSPDGASFVLAAGSDLRTFRVDDGSTRTIVPFPEPIVALASQKGVGRILVGQGSRVVAVDPRDKPDRGAFPVRAQGELPGPAKSLAWLDGGRAAGVLIADPPAILVLGGNDLTLLDRREQQADAIGSSGGPGVSELRWVSGRGAEGRTTMGLVRLSAEPPNPAPYVPAPPPVAEAPAPATGTTSAGPGPGASTAAPATPPVTPPPVAILPPVAPKTEAPPAKAEAPPSKAEAPPAKAEAPPAKAEAPPAKAEVPPAKTEAPPARADAPPPKTEAPPAKVEAPPKVEPPPAKAEAPPSKVETPPARTELPVVEPPPHQESAPAVIAPPPPPQPSPPKSAPPPAAKAEPAPARSEPPASKTEPPSTAPEKLPDAPPTAVPTPTSRPPVTTPPPPPAATPAPAAAQSPPPAAPQATQPAEPQTAAPIPAPAAPQGAPRAPTAKTGGEAPGGGSITGRITGQLALVAEIVVLGPDSLLKQYARVKVVPSEGGASFTLEHVPPGRYVVTPMGAHNASLSARPATVRVVVSGDGARADFEVLGAL